MSGLARSVALVSLAGLAAVAMVEAAVFLLDRRWVLPAVAVVVALLAVELRGRLAGGPEQAGPAADTTAEPLERWRSQAELMISWADGSRADWDRHLRPKLARDFMLASRQKDPALLAPAGRIVFGDLWPWVDPGGARPGGRDEPGPGRDALDAILDRMDRI